MGNRLSRRHAQSGKPILTGLENITMTKTILVVDDEQDLVEIVTSHLSDRGYRIVTAADGVEGFETAKREKPHLIILDIMMPRMSGLEMLDLLRGNSELASTPVLMLSAQGLTRNILQAEQLRAVEFVIKPFTRDVLVKAVDRAMI